MQALPMTFRDRRKDRDEDPIRGMPPLFGLADILTIDEAVRLYTHLHNGNGPFEWSFAFRGSGDKPTYVRSKTKADDVGIRWSVKTSFARGRVSKPIAFMPYPRNAAGLTCWGALDFDAHDGNTARARELAFKAWNHLRVIRPDLCLILETSDSGGWHVWIIKDTPVACTAVTTFLADVAKEIGAEVKRGICEVFPTPTTSNTLGCALRAPGGYHPGTNSCMQMTSCNLNTLIATLPPQRTVNSDGSFPKKEKYLFVGGNKEKEPIKKE